MAGAAVPEPNVPSMGQRTGTRQRCASTRNEHSTARDGACTSTPLANFTIFNVRGLAPRTVPTKVPFIKDILQDSNQLFIALSETWLNEHLDAELKIEGYDIFRSDRIRKQRRRRGRDSGGVAVFLREDLVTTAEPIITYSNGVVEILGIHLKKENLVILAMYRQPDDVAGGHRSTSHEFRQALSEIRKSLSELPSPTPEIVLCGDLNLPHMKWPDGTCERGTKDEKTMGKELMDLMTEHFMFQSIVKPTHRAGNTLDVCFSNNPELIHSYQCDRTTVSDHYMVHCRTTLNFSVQEETYTEPEAEEGAGAIFDSLNFMSEEVNWEDLERELRDHDWESSLTGEEPTDMLLNFTNICAQTAKKYVPERKKARNNKLHKIPRTRRILMRRRTKVNKQLASRITDTRRNKLNAEAVEIEKKLQHSYRSERSEMEHKAVSAIKRNSKYFYSYAKKFSKISTGTGPLFDLIDGIVSCPLKMADMLADQYSSVFSTPKETLKSADNIFTEQNPRGIDPLLDITFTEKDLEKAIGEISPTAAAGPDRFPAVLLKQCRSVIAKPLFMIWRKSLDLGKIPLILKTANIIPIHKGGSRGIPKNYRPIALTSHLIKVFEKVIRKAVVEHMEKHELFNPSQHGFRFGRSCLSQLMSHYDQVLERLERGENVDVIYIDFAKAFDKVDFGITLQKLNELGITGRVGSWIYSFLTNRTQSVLVNKARSRPAEVKSGVPQGSVLGPLLFLVLLGDIDANLAKAFLSSFADDTRIGSEITSHEDTVQLQNDLEAVYSWTDVNNMQLNSSKFECLRYGLNDEIKAASHYTSSTGEPIQEKTQVRDLGVIMEDSGSFSQHIRSIVDDAKRQCAWILRTFKTREVQPLLTLWKSLVQSKLEYCSQLWCPLKRGDIQAIEMVQRSFLRKLSGLNSLSYWEQLEVLKLYSLERRRERYRIIYIWRILEEQVPNIGTQKVSAKWHIRRGRECMIPRVNRTAHSRIKNLFHASLPVHGQQLFNTLPVELRNLTGCTTDIFKRKLDKYLSTVPDEPQIQGYTAMRRAESNSLLEMTRLATAGHQLSVVTPGDTQGCDLIIAMED